MGAVYQQDEGHKQGKNIGKKLILGAIYALLPLVLIHSFFMKSIPTQHQDLISSSPRITVVDKNNEWRRDQIVKKDCDYTNGVWVESTRGPKYNNTSCKTIRTGQNCLGNGRPDTGYLYWRWKPKQCEIHHFDPFLFLKLIENRHLAFIGDSMARNQLESLLCLLTTVSTPILKYQYGKDNRFRRWTLGPPYNVTISIYWSPFLVKAIDTTQGQNKVHMDTIDEKWGAEINSMDMIVFSMGHWFNKPAIYYEGDRVIGCHDCGENSSYTDIDIFDMMRKVTKTAMSEVGRRVEGDKEMFVGVVSFSPGHFEGAWDQAGACPKVRPYGEGEKEVGYVEREMRKVVVEEVEVAAKVAEESRKRFKVEVLDVTKLADMRPDGHPGHYIHPYVMAKGYNGPFPNDCLHWCLPGPIDTWNEILLELIKRRQFEAVKNIDVS